MWLIFFNYFLLWVIIFTCWAILPLLQLCLSTPASRNHCSVQWLCGLSFMYVTSSGLCQYLYLQFHPHSCKGLNLFCSRPHSIPLCVSTTWSRSTPEQVAWWVHSLAIMSGAEISMGMHILIPFPFDKYAVVRLQRNIYSQLYEKFSFCFQEWLY